MHHGVTQLCCVWTVWNTQRNMMVFLPKYLRGGWFDLKSQHRLIAGGFIHALSWRHVLAERNRTLQTRILVYAHRNVYSPDLRGCGASLQSLAQQMNHLCRKAFGAGPKLTLPLELKEGRDSYNEALHRLHLWELLSPFRPTWLDVARHSIYWGHDSVLD